MIFPSHPYDVEAWDMWKKVQDCHRKLFMKYGREYAGEMNTWDCYSVFCQECDEHDECFKHSDWFIGLIEG